MWHMVASALGVSIIMTLRPPSTGWPSFSQFWDYKYLLFLNSTCSTLNIALNNVSLTLISLFLNQVIKATAPAMTIPLSACIEGKRYGWGVILSVVVLVAGTILAVPTSNSNGVATNGAGVLLVGISAFAASLKSVVMSVAMRGTAERPKLAPTAVMFYDCGLAFFMMLIYWLASDERAASISYLGAHAGWGLGIIAAGASMAFCFNLSNYYFILSTSALTSAVTSNGVKIVILVVSAITDKVSSAQNICGIVLTSLAIISYTYFSYQAKKRPPAPLWPPLAKAAPPAEISKPLAGEATPLKR